jgi:predicted ATPase/DNA-binding SARP family transcriptional activator/predicted negative regulator of RcsB-dependent stress response
MSHPKKRTLDPQPSEKTDLYEGLHITLLGGFLIHQGEQTFGAEHFHLRKGCDLVKLLAIAPRHRLPREEVLEWLWPDGDPKSSANSLNQALRSARQVLEGFQPAVYVCNEDGLLELASDEVLWVDVEAFETAAAQARKSQDIALYRAALELYTGELLPEDRYAEWAIERRESLKQTHLKVLLELAHLHEARGENQPAIETYQKLIAVDPLIEEAHVGLMQSYALSGQRSQALRQYQVLQEILDKELGAEPDPDSQRMHRQILEGKYPPPKKQTQPAEDLTQALEVRKHNLPSQITSFIGREQELAQVQKLLSSHRLVTLTGPGGTGKTRLSQQAALELLEDFPDGVWLVELAPLADPSLVVQTTARALGMNLDTSSQALLSLQNFLETRHLLLILDNCEHLLESCAHLADALLKACPHLHILATSREALGIEGEAPALIPPLRLPETSYFAGLAQVEAIRLFVDRAATISPEFQLTEANAPAIVQICRRLDGIPLALELAAARVKLLRVEDIAGRLDDRFRLLTGGSRTALPRYQTLRASIDWSYDLLLPAERSLLQRLSVFSGGWVLEAAESVGSGEGIEPGDILDLIGQLVNKSLVTAQAEAAPDRRYQMLETIRQYASEKLVEAGESESVRDQHLRYYVALAERVENKLRGPDQAAITERLIADLDNLWLALRWSLEGKGKPGWTPEPGLRLVSALIYFWNSRLLHTEALEWLETLLLADMEERQEKPASPGRTLIRAKALQVAVFMANILGETERETIFLEESQTLFKEAGKDGQKGVAISLSYMGGVASRKGDVIQAKALIEESLALSTEVGDRFHIAECLRYLRGIAISQGDLVQASRLSQENLALRKEIGDLDGEAMAYINLGNIYEDLFDLKKARSLTEKGLQIGSLIKNTFLVSLALTNLGVIDWAQGKYEPAERNFIEAQSIGSFTSILAKSLNDLTMIGDLALSQGDFEKAADAFSNFLMINQKKNSKEFTAVGLKNFGDLALAKGDMELAISRYNEALTLRREIGHPYWEAIVLSGLSRAAFQKSDFESALRYSLESIGKWHNNLSHNNFTWDLWENPFPISIETLAFVAIQQGQMECAARLLGVSQDWHVKVQYTRTPQMRQEREKALAAVHESLGEEAFEKAWVAGSAMTLEQSISYAKTILNV